MSREKLYEYKTIRSRGAYHHLVKFKGKNNFQHHNWDGPSITPIPGEESEFETSYHLYGIEFNQEDYDEALRQREGLPWYKNPAIQSRL